ncbi:hypothetical protein SETIT_4G000600v2 [Setaria italica]|uniref:Uncharacterized protein n=2 Tax=Setaria TaxID=4554 RepID=A0A368QP49_SETIT|nr:hypothetical protein SETIT_4G000600v2 [Setaria italica]TKW19140.1 hypothetical protein SEVIR_4G001000v2 [Setaria viridis]
MPQLTRASPAPATSARASEDGSRCRFLALLASSPHVLPLFSLPNSLLLVFWLWRPGPPESQHASSPRLRLQNHV